MFDGVEQNQQAKAQNNPNMYPNGNNQGMTDAQQQQQMNNQNQYPQQAQYGMQNNAPYAGNNQAMVAPQMPMGYMQQMGPNPFMQTGMERLKSIPMAYAYTKARDDCHDYNFCLCQTTELGVKMNQMQTQDMFRVKLDKTPCFGSIQKGKMSSLDINQTPTEDLYDYKHTRKCFGLKCMFLGCHPIGMLTFSLCNKCNPGVTEIKKNNNTLFSLTYSFCAMDTEIKDESGNLKYKMINPGNCCDKYRRVLVDQNGQEVPNFQITSRYTGSKGEMRQDALITFPPNMSEDDRAAIIMACVKFN